MKNKKLVLYSGVLSVSLLFNVYGMNPLVKQEISDFLHGLKAVAS